MLGAGVPDTSHTSVVGWPDEVKTLGSPTSSTGAEGEGERGGMYLRVESKDAIHQIRQCLKETGIERHHTLLT